MFTEYTPESLAEIIKKESARLLFLSSGPFRLNYPYLSLELYRDWPKIEYYEQGARKWETIVYGEELTEKNSITGGLIYAFAIERLFRLCNINSTPTRALLSFDETDNKFFSIGNLQQNPGDKQ